MPLQVFQKLTQIGDGELGLKCGVASDKRICIPEVCVCIDSRDDKGDAAGGVCGKRWYIYIWIVNFISIYSRKFLPPLLVLLNNIPFFIDLSTQSCKQSLVMPLKIGVFILYVLH